MSTYAFSQQILISSLQQMLDSEATKMRKISDIHPHRQGQHTEVLRGSERTINFT